MIRIGCVPYLNAKPLLEGLDGVLLLPPADLVGRLISGSLDVALLPAIEVLRRGLAHVRGIAIASPGKTDSVRLHHAVPVSEIRRVALDRNSRTSNMLTRILLEKRHGLRPTYVVRDPTRGLSFKAVDAVVTIGDTSFRPGKRVESLHGAAVRLCALGPPARASEDPRDRLDPEGGQETRDGEDPGNRPARGGTAPADAGLLPEVSDRFHHV